MSENVRSGRDSDADDADDVESSDVESGPMAPRRPSRSQFGALIVIGGLLLTIGSVLPWGRLLSISAFSDRVARERLIPGHMADGPLILALAVVALAAGVLLLRRSSESDHESLLLVLLCASLAAGASAALIAGISIVSADANIETSARLAVGTATESWDRVEVESGLWISLVGAALVMAGALLGVSQLRRPKSQGPARNSVPGPAVGASEGSSLATGAGPRASSPQATGGPIGGRVGFAQREQKQEGRGPSDGPADAQSETPERRGAESEPHMETAADSLPISMPSPIRPEALNDESPQNSRPAGGVGATPVVFRWTAGYPRLALSAALVIVLVLGGVTFWLASGNDEPEQVAVTEADEPAAPVPKRSSSSTIEEVDFESITIEQLACGEEIPNAVTLKAGEWGDLTANFGIYLGNVQFGALSGGDGQQAMVSFSCTYGGNASDDFVAVFALSSDNGIVQLGEPIPGHSPSVPEQGQLVVWAEDYAEGDPSCCPSNYRRTLFELRGSRLRTVATTVHTADDYYEQVGPLD